MTRIVLDPVTRVGGHLRVEAEITDGAVTDAWVSGTSVRGLESVLPGRDARDAWLLAQRVCGTDGIAHALTCLRAIERALDLPIPPNARLVRNLLAGSAHVMNATAGFYRAQALDWIDLEAALTADPIAAASLAATISDQPAAPATFADAQNRLAAILRGPQPGIFASPFGGHPAYQLPPAADLMIATHLLQSFDWHREMARIHVILGGKSPHPQTFLLGGVSVVPEWRGPIAEPLGGHQWGLEAASPASLSPVSLTTIATLLTQMQAFVTGAYLPDVRTIAAAYRDWGTRGRGRGHYLAFGDLPTNDATDDPTLLLPRGRIMDRDLASLIEVDQSGVAESVEHAWYRSGGEDDGALLHPWDERTLLREGPATPITSLADERRYSWVRSPRYEDDPMEVGPLARLLVASAAGDDTVSTALSDTVADLGLGANDLFSTLGRTLARAVEAELVAGRLSGWLTELRDSMASGDLAFANIAKWEPASWPAEAQGWALGESTQGAVGHWVTIEGGRIATYQIVDAGTWNASPRDTRGRRGAIEEALVGTPVADPARPLEVLRTVRSFDPCLACATH